MLSSSCFYVSGRPPVLTRYHLRIFAPSDSLTVAARLRAVAVRAVAAIAGVDPATFGDPTDPSLTFIQLLSPVSFGGLGLPDPAFLAEPVALADLADALPHLLADTTVGPLPSLRLYPVAFLAHSFCFRSRRLLRRAHRLPAPFQRPTSHIH